MIELQDKYFTSRGIMLGNKLFMYIVCRLLAEETGYNFQTPPVVLVRHGEADRLIKFDDYEGKIITDPIRYFEDGSFFHKTLKQFAEELLELNAGASADGFFARYDLIKPHKERVKSIFSNLFSDHNIRNDDEVVIMLRDSHHDGRYKIPDEYYLSTLQQIEFNKLYVTSDVPSRHTSLLNKLEKYNPIMLGGDAFEQMNYVINFKTIVAAQGTFCFWSCFLSKADKIYWPVTTRGPNSPPFPWESVNLLVDDEDRYINIPVNNGEK